MNNNPGAADKPNRRVRPFLAIVVGFNLLLITISFSAWFSGTEKSPGFADQIFGKVRISGFRADFAWLLASTAVLFLALIVFIVMTRESHVARVNAALCLAEVFAFGLFLYHALVSGLLDFG